VLGKEFIFIIGRRQREAYGPKLRRNNLLNLDYTELWSHPRSMRVRI